MKLIGSRLANPTIWVCLCMAALLMFCSCKRSSRGRVVASRTQFTFDSDLYYETDTSTFLWDTTLDNGRVEFRVRNFSEGYARLRIYDDTGVKIFDEEYSDNFYFDEEFSEIDFTTLGIPGLWEIRLEHVHFSGHLYLVID